VIELKRLKVVNVVKKEEKKEKKLDYNDYINLIREYNSLNTEKLTIEKRIKDVRSKIDSFIDTNVKANNDGHRFFKTTDLQGNPLIIKREARESISINMEKGKELFEKKNVLDRVLVVQTVETENWDEDEIENLLAEEIITPEELQSILDSKVTYATKFVKQKELDEEGD
jgi:hypothetical protein